MHVSRPRFVARVGAFTGVGIVVASLLSRASDALWWRLLPWVLLAGLWTYLVIRNRRSPGDHEV